MMISLKILFLYILLLGKSSSYAQQKNIVRKDTLYYLLDTAKIPLKDRIIEIVPYPKNNIFYTYIIRTHCLVERNDPNLMSILHDPGELMQKSNVDKLKFISLKALNDLLCDENGHFRVNHELYFIEHLSGRKYLKRKVIPGATPYSTNDHILIDPQHKENIWGGISGRSRNRLWQV